jgi:large subunit ribosomal protein L4
MKLPILKINGEVGESVEVRDDVFDVAVKDKAIAQVYRAQNTLRHPISANTLKKGEVSGGGKKPWKQKGTGKARAGSSRSPVWRGGGITFGPSSERNPLLSVPTKMRQKATYALLARARKNKALFVIESSDKASRRDYLLLYKKAKIDDKKILFISDPKETPAFRTNRNLYNIHTIGHNSINLMDIIESEAIVFTAKGVAIYAPKTAVATKPTAIHKDRV